MWEVWCCSGLGERDVINCRRQLASLALTRRRVGAAARSQRGTIFFDTGLWFYSGLDMTLGHASVEESHHRLHFKLQT